MKKIKLGIIREGKHPIDKRVPLTPRKCLETMQKFPQVEIIVQPSLVRCFSDQEYQDLGITVANDMESCDILMGVKEVPVEQLIPNKTYYFFSHTIKKQPKNRKLLQEILKNKIRLIDYETLTTNSGERVVAFGKYAGIVGAYNAILTYGKKWNLFDLKPAHECIDMDDMKEEYFKVKLPNIKIVLTGGGRVANGAIEVLNDMGIREVSVFDYLYKEFNEPVFTNIHSHHYNTRPDVEVWDKKDFYENPQFYVSTFKKFYKASDLLIAGAFWNPQAPKLFTEEEMNSPEFKINTIADITCDIDGSIPSTKRASTIEEPVYDYNPKTQKIEPPFSRKENISVMAIDNLPCELPRNSSLEFGRLLIDNVFPNAFGEDSEEMIERATITEAGKLKPRYKYLEDYVNNCD